MGALWDEKDRFEESVDKLLRDRRELKESKHVYAEMMDDADQQIDTWGDLKEEFEDGTTVFAPASKPIGRKRKATKGSQKPRKRRRARSSSDSDSEDDENYADESSAGSISGEGGSDSSKEPLTEDQINTRLSNLKSTKKAARKHRSEIEDKMKTLNEEIEDTQVRKKCFFTGHGDMPYQQTFHRACLIVQY